MYHDVHHWSLLSRLSYEPDLNCHWTVTGPPDKVIKMRFTSFNLERRQNDTHHSCWDYVEVRNGDGPFSPQVGVFCGATAPPDLRSSRDHLWVKFFTDSDNSGPGFSAVFTAEDPVCGSLVPLNATNITQVKFIVEKKYLAPRCRRLPAQVTGLATTLRVSPVSGS